ncbi:MAG: transglutaminase TgpA family protein [Steroidobacteraceae bacterium]
MSSERQESFRRLAWTMAGLMAALGPHLLHLKPWVTGFVLAICAWRLLAERKSWRLPGTFTRGFIACVVTAGVVMSYTTITGLDGGTALLALMSALKLLETRNPRDHAVLIFIGWFLCLAAFLYAQDIATAAWVLPTVWLLAAALLQVSRRGRDGPAPRPFRTTGAMLLKAAPIALVLFLFFPRLPGSFWGAPSGERALSGLTEEMSPGDISDLTLNDVVAFRVRFAGNPPPPALRYWRGPVLSEFDGYSWSRGESQPFRRPRVYPAGTPVDYTVTLEPTGQYMLFALDMVESWARSLASQSWDFSLRTRKPVHAVLRYDARSYPRYRAGSELSPELRNHSLQLPPGRNARTAALARSMRAAHDGDAAYAQAVLDMFRTQDFYYTLTPPGLARDSVDDFLFNTRQGFCGHYASAFTMMMRAAGIPARVVAGYQGGDWNPIGGYLIVRQAHAHAWSEIWLADTGWTRIDPTGAISPERIERGIGAALPGAELLPGTLLRDSLFWWQAGMIWDNVNARWNDWVVQFNHLSQEELLIDLGFDDPDWLHFGIALGTGLALAVGLLFFWLAWDFRPRRADPAAATYGRFVKRLASRGIERSVGEAPRDFALRVRRLRPDLGVASQAITEIYLRLRYLPAPAAGDLRLLRGLVARFDQ